MSTSPEPESAPDEVPFEDFTDEGRALWRLARSSVIIGALTFFPGIALMFVYYLFAAPALAAGLVGAWRGWTALRQAHRGTKTWIAALLGIIICLGDVVMIVIVLGSTYSSASK